MTTFRNARFKLTAWYLLIIISISSAFSVVIYKMLTSEVDRLLAIQQIRMERQFVPARVYIDPELVAEVKNRLIIMLLSVNGVILVTSGVLGYILAGRTLQPIEVALEEQNRFIADASHELRTPLTAIKTEIEVALRDKHLSLAAAKTYLASNLEEIDKLKNLTNNLLTLSRVKSQAQLPLSDINLNTLVGKLCSKNYRLQNQVTDITIQSHPETLSELLTILIDNALKYSPADQSVLVKSAVHNKSVDIKIIDHGIGVKSTELPHIFDRFYRSDLSRNKTHIDGFGLGLSIAQNLAKSLNAKLAVRSVLDKGSTFTISLPK